MLLLAGRLPVPTFHRCAHARAIPGNRGGLVGIDGSASRRLTVERTGYSWVYKVSIVSFMLLPPIYLPSPASVTSLPPAP